ncbi:MAG TPA: ATP-binding protein [Opitutaceae bacterium]|nr:ATP-binding protein [Opitutaceae bacterium]
MIKISTSQSNPPMQGEDAAITARFDESLDVLRRHHDRFFAWLLFTQWIATIFVALIVSPRTWAGTTYSTHIHVWAAVLLGGAISLFPAWLGWKHRGRVATRHLIAMAQMLMSGLLIHLTGGRIETHFHVFGSLAFLAFYRDTRVLITATVVVYVDHLARGALWPESVYGVLVATPWRSIEHAFWVLFEVVFLTLSIRRGLSEMHDVAGRQVSLERINGRMEHIVTERTHALAESETRFRALFQDTPIGLYRAAPSGELQLANPAMLRLLGYGSVEEMRAARANLQGDGTRLNFFREITTNGAAEGHETQWNRRDGTRVELRETARAFRDANGQITHIDGSAEDVTAHRQLEERYAQAQKVQAIGQLAGGVAHDFNNILTAISGFAELALASPTIGADNHRRVSEIRKATDRAAALTHQMLAFSRKQTLQPRVWILNTIIVDLERMLHRLLGEHIRISTTLAPNLAPVKVDAGQIQQVILNLTVNARDAMPDGGTLQIQTANIMVDAAYARLQPGVSVGPHVMLCVTDTGTGMPPEVKQRLFEPFFTTKAPGVGTGLGLATCHGIVTQSGGHITVYSEVGLGSSFKVLLPACGEPTTDRSAAPFPVQIDRSPGGETVLLVEDEEQVRELATEVLSSFGYRVIVAKNGREALQHCTGAGAGSVALILTDIVMPDMGGRELARRAREATPNLPIIFTSGFTFETIPRDDTLERGQFFLSKPYAMTEMAQKVREALDAVAAR